MSMRLALGWTAGLAALALFCSPAHAGSLDPPGPPAPTMKTLQEMEPRIPISEETTPGDAGSVFRITEPGSYYLTGNLTGVAGKHGIIVDPDDVTLDLRGFALDGVAGSLSGIVWNGSGKNVAILDGVVRGWGVDGIDMGGASRNVVLRDLRVSANGGDGLNAGFGTLVVHCVSANNGGSGMVVNSGSVVVGSVARENGSVGIAASSGSTVRDSVASGNTGQGILAGGGVVTDSFATNNGGDGIVGGAGTVSRCTSSFNSGHGIRVSGNSSVVGNNSYNNGVSVGSGAGIHVAGFRSRIEGNHVTQNDTGIEVTQDRNMIFRNSAAFNGVDYDIAPGNDVGPIGNAATATSPFANLVE